MNNQLKIITILPYKENYTKTKAQAAAIWVHDFLKYSRYKKYTIIIGNTEKTIKESCQSIINITITTKLILSKSARIINKP